MVRDHLPDECGPTVGRSVDRHFLMHLAVNCGQACVEGTVLVAAAKEVLAVAVLIFLTARGVRLRVPGAARLVERSDLRGWREQVKELGRGARLSSLEDDLGRHCLVDVAKVEDRVDVGVRHVERDIAAASATLFFPRVPRVEEERFVLVEPKPRLVVVDSLALEVVLDGVSLELGTLFRVVRRAGVVRTAGFVGEAHWVVPV
mmetsp:Transcript_20190/g.63336  ORF Transcript_20190/g.63336 Transcript_20190/m.63336 type:complete len:203 (-) Transcript_20190:263-871(-)